MSLVTDFLELTYPEVGESGWGAILNALIVALDEMVGGSLAVVLNSSGNSDVTEPSGPRVVLSGTPVGTTTVRFARAGVWHIYNGTGGAQTVNVSSVGGSAVALTRGAWHIVGIGADGVTTVTAALQAYNANLAALAGLTLAADKLPYATGVGALALADLSAYARTILDDANAGAMLTTLGVSAFAQTILDDAAAGDVRTTLGLGSLAVLSSINNGNWSGADLAVANGGTGASTPADARTNLELGTMAVRNVTVSTSAPSGGSDGDFWFVRAA